jgi:uncharacterized membrane protein
MTFFILLYAGTGLLLILLGIPFIQGRIGPNHWAGLRIPATTEHPEVWYPANRYAGRWLAGLGVINLAASLLIGFWPGMNEDSYVAIMTAILLGGLALGLGFSWRYASNLAKQL